MLFRTDIMMTHHPRALAADEAGRVASHGLVTAGAPGYSKKSSCSTHDDSASDP